MGTGRDYIHNDRPRTMPTVAWMERLASCKQEKESPKVDKIRSNCNVSSSLVKIQIKQTPTNAAGIVLCFGTGRTEIKKMPSPRESEIGTGDVRFSNKIVGHTLVQSQSLKIQRVEMR